MKTVKFYDIVLTAILIPLFLSLITDFIKQIPWLHISIIIITLLIILLILIRTIVMWFITEDIYFIWQSRKMDAVTLKARKKLEKTIAKTNDSSIMEYAFNKLREVCPPEVYSGILYRLAEKERRTDKKETLFIRAKSKGGNYENKKK